MPPTGARLRVDQATTVAIVLMAEDGQGERSWLYWPRASSVIYHENEGDFAVATPKGSAIYWIEGGRP